MSTASLPAGPAGSTAPRPPKEIVDRGLVRRDGVRAERWRLKGTAKILGPVDVGRAEIEGTLIASAGFTANSLEARGSIEIAGPIAVRDTLVAEGSFLARGPVRTGAGTLDGTVRLEGGIEATQALRVRGSLRAASLQAGTLRLEGAAEVPGLVRAHTLEARLGGHDRIGAIEAHEVRLRGHRENLLDWALLRRSEVHVGRIEADRVELEAADVEFVRARVIVLGPGAHIDRFEGAVVRAHPTSRVGPESRGPLPAGLRR